MARPYNKHGAFWTKRRLAQLRALWRTRKSAAQIAKHIGDGCTRNAVIGKAYRLGLPSRVVGIAGAVAR